MTLGSLLSPWILMSRRIGLVCDESAQQVQVERHASGRLAQAQPAVETFDLFER